MTVKITMHQPVTGDVRLAYFGFSWTTLVFGPLPALWRGDVKRGTTMAIGSVCFNVLTIYAAPQLSAGVLSLWFICWLVVWALIAAGYNNQHAHWLADRGYKMAISQKQLDILYKRKNAGNLPSDVEPFIQYMTNKS